MSLDTFDPVSSFQRFLVKSINLEKFREWKRKYDLKMKIHRHFEEIDPLNIKNSKKGEHLEDNFSVQSKIDILLKESKSVVVKELNMWKASVVRDAFNMFMSSPCFSESKECSVNSLASFFFYKKDNYNISERKKEHENLKQVDLSHPKMFLNFGNVTMPCEIVVHILSFVGYNGRTMKRVSVINRTLYLIILQNWPSISLSSRNIYSTPLIVLRNVRKAIIRTDFRIFQMNYLYDQLRNVRILHLNSNNSSYLLSHIHKRKKEQSKNYPFENVTSLKFIANPITDLFNGCIQERLRLKTMFPKLRNLENPSNLQLLQGLDVLLKLILDLGEKAIDNLFFSKNLKMIPQTIRFLGLRNSQFLANDMSVSHISNTFHVLVKSMGFCEDLATIVCESYSDHKNVDIEKIRMKIVHCFNEEENTGGFVDLKKRRFVEKEVHFNGRNDFVILKRVIRARLIWKKSKSN